MPLKNIALKYYLSPLQGVFFFCSFYILQLASRSSPWSWPERQVLCCVPHTQSCSLMPAQGPRQQQEARELLCCAPPAGRASRRGCRGKPWLRVARGGEAGRGLTPPPLPVLPISRLPLDRTPCIVVSSFPQAAKCRSLQESVLPGLEEAGEAGGPATTAVCELPSRTRL